MVIGFKEMIWFLFMDTEGEGQDSESNGFPFSVFSRLEPLE